MRQIRKSVFETNSSMTHSIVMCKSDDYEGWEDGKMMFGQYHDKPFLPNDEAVKYNANVLRKWLKDLKSGEYACDFAEDEYEEFLTEENIQKYERGEIEISEFGIDTYEVNEYMYVTYDFWYENVCDCYETFQEDYEQNGEKVTAFGYFGHD